MRLPEVGRCGLCGGSIAFARPEAKYCSCRCSATAAALARDARSPVSERFWRNVRKSDGCWEWTAYRDGRGYGSIRSDGATWRAHRLSWVMAHGPILPGLFVCHRCDNPPCVNPVHLFLGTPADNMRDMDAKGRRVAMPGALNRHAKLTPAQVIEIRRRAANGERGTALAAEFGISQPSAHMVIVRKNWRHLP